MSERKRWATKAQAQAFINAYEKRVDKKDAHGHVIAGNKGLSYWAAKDYVDKSA